MSRLIRNGIEGFERSLLPPVEVKANTDNPLSLLATGALSLPPDDAIVSWYETEPWPIVRTRRIVLSTAKLTKLYDIGGSLRAAAMKANVCPEIFRREMVRQDLPRRPIGRPTMFTLEEVVPLFDKYKSGLSLQEVADQSEGKVVHGQHLGKIFRRNGFKTRPRGPLVKDEM